MKSSFYVLGVDVGSVSVNIAAVSPDAEVVHTGTAYHHGDILGCLSHLFNEIHLPKQFLVAATDSSSAFVRAPIFYDSQLTILKTAAVFHRSVDAILHIGGETFSLSRFDANGSYIGSKHNTSCAAGTGSFLDQQARRLNLFGGAAELCENALANTGEIPDIATRCSVFAKTDLIHAQQEGYNISQICDGLCSGLAKNISNTLFKHENLGKKILFCGGVSKNRSVMRHLENLTGYRFLTDAWSQFYSAIGAALCFLEDSAQYHPDLDPFSSFSQMLLSEPKESTLVYPKLELTLSQYPEFSSFAAYTEDDVEVDIYQDPALVDTNQGFLGLDVGSTSTKSILINSEGIPVAGLYTKTASRPVQAVQKIFRAYDRFFDTYGIKIEIKGCGTTGSGRRISGKIIGADIEPDEITAHATAACHLNPEVDTIIEIGGQDAKFTLLKNGIVTASVMNTVCAAGTGSFIEEQAMKLGCPLSEYSGRTEGVSAPVSSDRCTVFMERDINHYLAKGFKKDEILASVLHSVRDNYLSKVATMGKIGNCILFQGATARNKALVAAFEQKLKKPIHVSRYCHLTGALGVALMVREKPLEASSFRGFELWEHEIPVRREICDLCTNSCKLTIAEINGETLAYGFLCGRDYQTNKRVSSQRPYDLLKVRNRAAIPKTRHTVRHDFTIGIPRALHLHEDCDFWEDFFSRLGIRTIVSPNLKTSVKLGKKIAKAEFCAPIASLHGHVSYLADKADYVFLPFYFEDNLNTRDRRRQHCYYTQFAPSVVSCLPEICKSRIISPIIKYLYTNFHAKLEMYNVLKQISADFLFSFFDISSAWDTALKRQKECTRSRQKLYEEYKACDENLNVLFLGRPYTILDKTQNNGIPRLFENLGARTFFQDMLDLSDVDFAQIDPLLKEVHWKYVAQILKAAYVAGKTDNLYPVYISSFKCAPDSFGIDYVKQILESFNKPYLILELDEHDSSVGYETRVEAAVNAFQNHRRSASLERNADMTRIHPRFLTEMGNRHVIFPNWDIFTGRLIVSVLKSEGFSAFLTEETSETLKRGALTNTGQCLPLNAVAEGFIHTVEKHHLNPADSLLWLNPSEIACNIKLYPYHIQTILDKHGNGFEKAGIYKGELSLFDISVKASTNAYLAYMFGGLLRSIGCKIRPYELEKGQTDKVLAICLDILCQAFEGSSSKEEALKRTMDLLKEIQIKKTDRPKVGIFGDLYVRDNDTMNQDLIHYIEENGGEVVTTPYYKYVKIIAGAYFKKWFKEGKYLSLISYKSLLVVMKAMEKKYYKYFKPFFSPSEFEVNDSFGSVLQEYGMLQEHTGESMDNILKIHHLVNEYPDITLLVQTNPGFCCPGLITEAMAQKIESKVKIPIVSITYDVSGGNKNRVILPFLQNGGQKTYSHSRKVSV